MQYWRNKSLECTHTILKFDFSKTPNFDDVDWQCLLDLPKYFSGVGTILPVLLQKIFTVGQGFDCL